MGTHVERGLGEENRGFFSKFFSPFPRPPLPGQPHFASTSKGGQPLACPPHIRKGVLEITDFHGYGCTACTTAVWPSPTCDVDDTSSNPLRPVWLDRGRHGLRHGELINPYHR